MELLNYLQYGFVIKALIAGSFIAVLCSVLGILLVLRNMSMIGDGLSHMSFGAISLGMLLGVYPFFVAVPVVIAASWLIWRITDKIKAYGDSAIGIVSAVGIAGGVILASLSGGFNVDLFSYLFGSILSISQSELFITVFLSTVILTMFLILYHDLVAVTMDEEYAKISGIPAGRINSMLFILTAVTVVMATKAVGIMLVSSLLVIPAVSSLQLSRGFKMAFALSAFFSVVSVVFGIILSLLLDLPSGASIVAMNIIILFSTVIIKKTEIL